jgi:hypothetical protein
MTNNNKIKIEREEEKTSPKFADRFGGITDVSLVVRLPTSYLKSIQLYAEAGDMTPAEYMNEMVISMVESQELAIVNEDFHKKFHLGELSGEERSAMVKRNRYFNLSNVTVIED